MCGRGLVLNPAQCYKALNGTCENNADCSAVPNYNFAPSQTTTVMTSKDVRPMKWGLVASFVKPNEKPKYTPINARSETVDSTNMFRRLTKSKRCIVAMDGFYEWKQKRPYLMTLEDKSPMFMASLWDSWIGPEGDELDSFTVLTTSSDDLAWLHNRMPVILDKAGALTWLDSSVSFDEIKPLLVPRNGLVCTEVSTFVNSPKNNSQDCILSKKEYETLHGSPKHAKPTTTQSPSPSKKPKHSKITDYFAKKE